MRLHKLFCLSLITLSCNSVFATDHAASTCDGTKQNPCIVQDTQNNSRALKNWRTSKSIIAAIKNKKGNTTGLDDIWMSGSGVSSIDGFYTIVINIQNVTNGTMKKIIDVDLRQESHGYLNNNAITLAAENDWGNVGKTRKQVFTDEKKWLKDLSQAKSVAVLTPAKFQAKQFQQSTTLPVKTVKNEKEVAESRRVQYFRLTVTDYTAPTDEDVDRFVELARKSKKDTWLHFHDRNGDGRTTTFMVMYDMLHNADKVSLEDIVKRQAAVPPYFNVLKTENADENKVALYQKRAVFLRKFYIFAQAYLNGYIEKWSTWSNKHRDL